MAESQAQARPSIRFTAAVARGLRESAVIAIGVAAIVLLIALATYSPCDPGYSIAGACAGANNPSVHNRIGPIGAWLADVLFFLLGRPAFLLPFMLGASAWVLHRRIPAEPSSRINSVVRVERLPAAARRKLRSHDPALVPGRAASDRRRRRRHRNR